MRTMSRVLLALIVLLGVDGRSPPKPLAASANPAVDLVGEWRAQLQFTTGAFAPIKDLEFMYVVHPDGTLTESSNYDAAPPVPPAYGVWRGDGLGRFQLHYEFYTTAAPKPGAGLGGGWPPAGRGLLDETLVLAPDGRTFSSQIRLVMLDAQGRPTGDGGEARGRGQRIGFADSGQMAYDQRQ